MAQESGAMTPSFGADGNASTGSPGGVTTFIVNQQGVVFQKDLGPDTETVAAAIPGVAEAVVGIVLGRQPTSHRAIQGLSSASPAAGDYWDGNWLSVTVRMQAGAFRGEYQAMVRADELAQLREGLANLHAVLQGTATLESREGVLAMRVEGDGHGHFVADCTARDQPGIGNTLQFALRFDQTDLPPVLASLDAVLARFPVTGCRTG